MQSDEALYELVRAGQISAFDELYHRYEERLLAFLTSMLGNRADAEDAFHDAFLNALRSREITFDRGSFRTWLFRIARNVALNKKRTENRGKSAALVLTRPEAPVATTAEEHLHDRQLRLAFDGAVSRLPPALSEVYHLRSAGMSYAEMAEVLAIPLGTLKSRLNQMVVRL